LIRGLIWAFLADSAYFKAFFHEPRSNAFGLIPLQFEGPVFYRAAASTGGPEPFSERFEGVITESGIESVDNNDDFPSPVGGFPPHDDATFFYRSTWRGGLFELGISGLRGWKFRQSRDF